MTEQANADALRMKEENEQLKGSNIELLKTLKRFTLDEPLTRSEYGGWECFYCGADVVEVFRGDDYISHDPDCAFKQAKDLIIRIEGMV